MLCPTFSVWLPDTALAKVVLPAPVIPSKAIRARLSLPRPGVAIWIRFLSAGPMDEFAGLHWRGIQKNKKR